MRDFAMSGYANVHRGVHYLRPPPPTVTRVRGEAVRKFLNAARDEEIVFTKGGTEAINLVAASYLAPLISPGTRSC